MNTRTWLVVGLALAIGGSALGQPGGAKQDAPKSDPPKPAARKAAPGTKATPASKVKATDLGPTITQLSGANVEAAAKAAETLGASPDPSAHEALLDALALGLPPEVAVPAVVALAQHPAPPDVAALRRYANHHNPSVRGSAFGALAMYPDPAAHAAVINGLHDGMGIVRGAAAAAAAKGHLREAIEPLFQLLARSEEPAARALAQMADTELARKIGDQLGHVPDPILAQCLGFLLKRSDFGPDPARVDVVRALSKIQDSAAVSALTDYIDATPKNPPRASRTEASKIVEARLGGGK